MADKDWHDDVRYLSHRHGALFPAGPATCDSALLMRLIARARAWLRLPELIWPRCYATED